MNRLVFALGLFATAPLAAQQRVPGPVAITGVAVVDPVAGRTTPERLVVIANGRIAYAGPMARARIPAGSLVVDGRGRFLIPGLWDMHVHLTPDEVARADLLREYYFSLLIANGVTGVRDMGGNLVLLSRWRDAVTSGALLGPRLVLTGARIRPGGGAMPGAPFPVQTREQLRANIAALRQARADHVKIVNIPAGLVRAAVEEGAAAGLPVVGHLPPEVRADSAIAAGLRSIEHMHALLNTSAADEDRLIRRQERFIHRSALRRWLERRLAGNEPRYPMVAPEAFRDDKLLVLARYSLAGHTWFTPTLRQTGANWSQAGPLFDRGPAEYRRVAGSPDSVWAGRRPAPADSALWAMTLRAVGLMHRGGARLLAGTDFPAPATIAGFGLHDELALLVGAGLPPPAALQAATTAPADYLAESDSTGRVATGYAADLVLLDADPLLDIAATRRIRAVVRQGRLLDRAELDALLARAAAIATASREGRRS